MSLCTERLREIVKGSHKSETWVGQRQLRRIIKRYGDFRTICSQRCSTSLAQNCPPFNVAMRSSISLLLAHDLKIPTIIHREHLGPHFWVDRTHGLVSLPRGVYCGNGCHDSNSLRRTSSLKMYGQCSKI